MRTLKTFAMLAIAAVVLLGASCSKKSPATTDTSADAKSAYSDTCGNPYYPFKPGLTIAYQVTPAVGAVGSSDYTISIVKVEGTTATTRAEMFNGAIAEIEADCASGSVALKGSSGLGAALEGVTFKTTVVSSSGSSMPARVKTGTTWAHSEC